MIMGERVDLWTSHAGGGKNHGVLHTHSAQICLRMGIFLLKMESVSWPQCDLSLFPGGTSTKSRSRAEKRMRPP